MSSITLKVNGKPSEEFENHVLHDGEIVLIEYGAK